MVIVHGVKRVKQACYGWPKVKKQLLSLSLSLSQLLGAD